MLKAVNLRTEYLRNPLGMDEMRPRFSYELEGDSLYQSARRIVVTDESGAVVWDSGRVGSDRMNQIEYDGEVLRQFTRYHWLVLVFDEKGAGEWSSEDAWFETGFLGAQWQGKWIAYDSGRCRCRFAARIVRDFTLPAAATRARLCVSALGVYEARINGAPVTDWVLTPGWTDYFTRVQYQVFDVTKLLESGENALSFELAPGWFSGRISRQVRGENPTYGGDMRLLAELKIDCADGSTLVIPSDGNFRCFSIMYGDGFDVIRSSDLYDGEYFVRGPRGDAWRRFGVARDRTRAMREQTGNPRVVWQSGAPVRRIAEFEPVKITRRSPGCFIVDFGQNFAGREFLRVAGAPSGTTITVRHGEMLNSDGSLYVDNLRSADATTIFVTGGAEVEEYEPRFTFYGFRYLEIGGWPGELAPEMIRARAISSDLEPSGTFECSSKLVNQLYSNILWGQRTNFVDIPTDCPQRDERLGWTGDTQIFANVATYNFFCAPFYTKWLEDLNSCAVDGVYPHIAPNPYRHSAFTAPASGWGDAGVVCPEVMLIKYGDTRLLRKYLANICRWLDVQIERAGGKLVVKNACYGDWLNLDDPTSEELISTAYLAGMTAKAARMAKIVQDEGESAKRHRLFDAIRAAFIDRFFTPAGALREKSQTAALLALEFDLAPEKSRRKVVRQLKENLRRRDFHLATGFLGTPLLLGNLARAGETELAYRLLEQTGYPGWLFPVTQGATTMWERWNSFTLDRGFGEVGMNSFNHYAYGAVGEWFYETICGIRPITDDAEGAGFRRFRLAPQPGGSLKWANARYHSISGVIESGWKRTGNKIVWHFTVPANTTAEVIFPTRKRVPAVPGLTRNGKSFIAAPGRYQVEFEL